MSDNGKLTIKDLQPDGRNANKGTARGLKMIEASLQQDGFGRSILVDKNGNIIAGNKTVESVANTYGVDAEVILVKTTGNQVVAVQREDLDLDDPDPNNPARRLAYRDNLTHEFSFELDPGTVMADIEAGFDFEAIDIQVEDLGNLLGKATAEMLPDEFPEYDEAIADEVEFHECPECGHKWPK